jgi:hypothetical protein
VSAYEISADVKSPAFSLGPKLWASLRGHFIPQDILRKNIASNSNVLLSV